MSASGEPSPPLPSPPLPFPPLPSSLLPSPPLPSHLCFRGVWMTWLGTRMSNCPYWTTRTLQWIVWGEQHRQVNPASPPPFPLPTTPCSTPPFHPLPSPSASLSSSNMASPPSWSHLHARVFVAVLLSTRHCTTGHHTHECTRLVFHELCPLLTPLAQARPTIQCVCLVYINCATVDDSAAGVSRGCVQRVCPGGVSRGCVAHT